MELLDQRFFQTLNYSAVSEDSASERRALTLKAGDRVLALTGSGVRALDLLADGPGEVVALDCNPAQTALLNLMVAAVARWDRAECAAFLGAAPMAPAERRARFAALAAALPVAARTYWATRGEAIGRGVFYAGRWEAYLRFLAGPLQFVRPRRLRALFEAPAAEAQTALWPGWDTPGWRVFLRMLGQRWLWRTFLPEPGIAVVPPGFDIAAYIIARFRHAGAHLWLRRSPFAWMLFRGRMELAEAVPAFLEAEHFNLVKARLDRLQPVTAPLAEYLAAAPPASFDAFSLSDFGSYLAPAAHAGHWALLHRAARPGARLLERQFLTHHEPGPPRHGRRFLRDTHLEADLGNTDNAFLYRFTAGTFTEGAAA